MDGRTYKVIYQGRFAPSRGGNPKRKKRNTLSTKKAAKKKKKTITVKEKERKNTLDHTLLTNLRFKKKQ